LIHFKCTGPLIGWLQNKLLAVRSPDVSIALKID
jgi:hypothetical protein